MSTLRWRKTALFILRNFAGKFINAVVLLSLTLSNIIGVTPVRAAQTEEVYLPDRAGRTGRAALFMPPQSRVDKQISNYESPAIALEDLPPTTISTTYYVDAIRTTLTEVATGNVLSVANAAGIMTGDEVLVMAMQGTEAGQYETAYVGGVLGNQVELSTTLVHTYDPAGGSVMVQTVPHFGALTVASGGNMTAHAWDGTTGGVVFFRAASVMIQTGGQVNVNGLGYRGGAIAPNNASNPSPGEGPGGGNAGVTYYFDGTGGGGGGYGSTGYIGHMGSSCQGCWNMQGGIGGIVYGDMTLSDFSLGSGGGGGGRNTSNGKPGKAGQPGGGIIYMDAQDVQVFGKILANGLPALAKSSCQSWDEGGGGAGSGGSIYLKALQINIDLAASVNALGGDGNTVASNHCWYGGKGGNGRIRLDYGSLTGVTNPPPPYSPVISASFSTTSADTNQRTADGQSPITITVTVRDQMDQPMPGVNVVVHASGSASVTQPSGPTDLQGRATSIITDATVEAVTVTAEANGVLITQNVSVRFNCPPFGDLIVASGDLCRYDSGSYSFNSIVVQDGGTLTLLGNPSLNQGVTINASSLTVNTGGIISADGAGYLGTYGNGGGLGGGTGAIYTGGGGGYGGRGQSADGAGGQPYGSVAQPLDLGSAGGAGRCGLLATCMGGTGGGAIHFAISTAMQVDGKISADGVIGGGRAGGGSGGSILIEAASLGGSGVIQAKGGPGNNNSGSGAGGRIAVYVETSTYTGTFSASGGTNWETGGQGSVYLNSLDVANSTIQITPAQVSANGTDTARVDVTLLDVGGAPAPGKPVDIAVSSGAGLYINNQSVGPNEYISIGNTDGSGVATAYLKTFTAGARMIKAQSGQQLLTRQGTVAFVAGAVSPNLSDVSPRTASAPSDGVTAITITVTAHDDYNNPIPGASVTLQTTGSAALTQPAGPTDSQGRASGQIVDATVESVTVTAIVNGVTLDEQSNLRFTGTDLSLSTNAPGSALANSSLGYGIAFQNVSGLPAQNVVLQVQLPNEVSYVNQDSPVIPTQNGQTLSWDFGTVNGGAKISFVLTGHISASTPIGSILNMSASVSTSSIEDTPGNNSSTAQTSIVDGYDFAPSLTPSSQTLSVGSTALYQINLQNTGLVGDQYDLSVSGLEEGWYTLSQSSLALDPGEKAKASLAIQVTSCSAAGNLPFQVNITSTAEGQIKTLSGSVTFQSNPMLSGLVPQNGSMLGSQDVTVNWQSDTPSTGVLTVFPVGQEGNATTFDSPLSTSHSVVAPGLTRTITYEWYVSATTDCGTTTTAHRTFTIGNGIVFVNRSQNATVNRDYDQRLNISVRNDDSNPHTLRASMLSPYDDSNPAWTYSGSWLTTSGVGPYNNTTHYTSTSGSSASFNFSGSSFVFAFTGDTNRGTVDVSVDGASIATLNEYYPSLAWQRTYRSPSLTPGPHTVTFTFNGDAGTYMDVDAITINPYDDILVNFVDSGSIDEVITLQPSETRALTLAVFAQDAQSRDYDLTASLVADMDTAAPIYDNMTLHITVLSDGNFGISEDTAAFDPLTLAQTFVITNYGKPVSDLSLSALTETGVPANIFLQPSVDHAYLGTGQSIKVKTYPIFGPEDASGQGSNLGSPHLASPRLATSSVNFTLQATGAGKTVRTSSSSGCSSSIIPVQLQNFTMCFNANNWYCTNRPDITTPIQVPSFINSGNISSAKLSIDFEPHADVQPHSGEIDFNGAPVASFTDNIPSGPVSLNLPPASWTNGTAGLVAQNVHMSTQHKNDVHYVSVTNYQLQVTVSQATTYVCASSPSAAQEIVQKTYACPSLHPFNPFTDVYPVDNSGNNKSAYGATTEDDTQFSTSVCGTQASCGDPINTHTGVFSFTAADLTLSTLAGNLAFQRSYSSGHNEEAGVLGYGWSYNQEAKLIFPEDEGGMEGYMLFQGLLGNRFLFQILPDGSFKGGPGVLATLTQSSSTYTLTTSQQSVFQFDESGHITSRRDAIGNGFDYHYDGQGRLDQISAGGGVHYIAIHYNEQGRIDTVSDNAGRQVTYGYNDAGDLTSAHDILGKTWTYTYDANHRMTEMLDPEGAQTTKTDYDLQGRAYRQFDGAGNRLALIVYNNDGTTTIYDAQGNPSKHQYNEQNINNQSENQLGQAVTKTFDPNFRPATIKDPRGNTSHFTWSADGANLTDFLDAVGNTTHVTYNSLNKPTSLLDPLNRETKYFYEEPNFPNLPTRIEYPAPIEGGSPTVMLYEYYQSGNAEGQPAGKVKLITDNADIQTLYTYTSFGQVASTTKAYGTPSSQTTTYAYDALGDLTDQTEGGITMHYTYDDARRLTSTVSNYDTIHEPNAENKYNLTTLYYYDTQGNQIGVKGPDGVITRTYYDEDGRPVVIVQNLAGQAVEEANPPQRGGAMGENLRTDYYYEADGKLIATQDPFGIITRAYYDKAGRPETIVQNLVGQGIVINTIPPYNSAYPDQNVHTQYVYDANGNPIATIDNRGTVTRTYYDELNRPIHEVQDLSGNITDAYSRGNCGTIHDLCTDTVYDAEGNTIATIDPAGVITRTYYDALNRPVTVVQNLQGQDITDADPPGRLSGDAPTDVNIRTDVLYDQAGNVIAMIDPRGILTRTYFDPIHRPLYVVQNWVGADPYDPNPPSPGTSNQNLRTDITYDSNGRRSTTTDPLRRVTKYEYNELGQLATLTANYNELNPTQNYLDKFNLVTAYSYDAVGRVLMTTDTLSRVTVNSYDLIGRLLSTAQNYLASQGLNFENQYNIVTSYTYDADGNRLTVTDPNGQTSGHMTTTAYDGLNRPVSVTDANGHTTTTTYNASGNMDSVADALQHTTHFTYDDLGQQVTVRDPLGQETHYLYNSRGLVALMTDAKGIVTRYQYDNLGRLSAVIENYQAGIPADSQTNVETDYTYDANGNRLSIRDGNGNTTTFTYDELNRLKSERDPLGHGWQYDYDAIGNRVTMGDANNQLTYYVYDEVGRLKEIHYPDSSMNVSFTYDPVGRRTYMTDKMGETSWVYDQLDRATRIGGPVGGEVDYAYDPAGNRTQLSYPNGTALDYAYDPANRLTAVTNGQSSLVGYQYDDANRLTNITRPNGVDSAYQYDDAGDLLQLQHVSGLNVLASFQYTYDPLGNRIQAFENVKYPGEQLGSTLPSHSQMEMASAGPAANWSSSLLPPGIVNPTAPAVVASPAAGTVAANPQTSLTTGGTYRSGGYLASFSKPQIGPLFAPKGQNQLEGTPEGTAETPTEASTPVITSTPAPLTGEAPTETLTPVITSTLETPGVDSASIPFEEKPGPHNTPQGALVVNLTGDGGDSDLKDGLCDDGTGACTLRAAIEQANADPGKGAIAFNLPGEGPYIIQPASPLPAITNPLLIDGATQPGYAGTPIVVLDGSLAGDEADGLQIAAGGSTVRGLVINGFSYSGIHLIEKSGTSIEENYIGTDATGTIAKGNRVGVLVDGASGNNIGGVKEETHNLISGNFIGVYIYGKDANGNQVQGNIIGMDASGKARLANNIGLRIQDGTGNVVGGKEHGANNLINGHARGILLEEDDASNNDVQADAVGNAINIQPGVKRQGEPGQSEGTSGPQSSIQPGAAPLASTLSNQNPAYYPASLHLSTLNPRLLAVGSTFVVNSTADTADKSTGDGVCDAGRGVCTLRAAIQQANTSAGQDTINFNISGSGPYVIQPRSALPTITDPVVVDGTTQPGYNGTPRIQLDGSRAGAAAIGLNISAGSSTVRGLVIYSFDSVGIQLSGAGGDHIEGNYIGTDVTGSLAKGNHIHGIYVNNVPDNVIGGATTAARNLFSANLGDGIYLYSAGATRNLIQGNYIGTNATGSASLGNDAGIVLDNAPGNTIGGTASGAPNLISGNLSDGIHLFGPGSNNNLVQGNLIGTNLDGTAALGNYYEGILVNNAVNNTIGGTQPGARNLVSGNRRYGIYFYQASNGNLVQGNIIGTAIDGTQDLGNLYSGIAIGYGASNNVIGGIGTVASNLISGNDSDGVLISELNTNGNTIQGNYIGTDVTGTLPLGNTYDGIGIQNYASDNIIGGAQPGAGNLISANTAGITLYQNANGNVVQGNIIGADLTGSQDLGNGDYGQDPRVSHGIYIYNSIDTIIGGTSSGAGNLISGNFSVGLYLDGQWTGGTIVKGNLIGTDITGTHALGNGTGIFIDLGYGNVIGGTETGARNVISGNGGDGIAIAEFGTVDNVIRGNYIGTDVSGTHDLGNGLNGVAIDYGASNNHVGGTEPGARNLISGNDEAGVLISESSTTGNTVQGNYIGTDVTGTLPLGNNADGIHVQSSASGTLVGGTADGAGNLVAANGWSGIRITASAFGNTVQGNIVGTDPSGTLALGNTESGISVNGPNNLIGGTDASAANRVAHNTLSGIYVQGGTGNALEGNLVWANGGLGIDLDPVGATTNDASDADTGPNNLQNFPVLTSAASGESTTVSGTLNSAANTTYRLEFFANATCDASGYGEGGRFLGTTDVTTDADGNAAFEAVLSSASTTGESLTSTATDPLGNTSEFSACVTVSQPVPTITPTPVVCDSTTTLVSVNSSGAEGDNYSGEPVSSADGRYVVFSSMASNLVEGDTTYDMTDIFVRDMQSGTITRVSVSSSGIQANAQSESPAISADGRYVVFSSMASNLVEGDTNGEADVFVHDMQSGTTTSISVGLSGEYGAETPSISADGRYVAFSSLAPNLVEGDTNGDRDVFVHDMQTGSTTRVSISSSGAQANSGSIYSAISANGRYVAFISDATNLVEGDTNNGPDVFLHDMQSGTTTRVSVSSSGAQADNTSLLNVTSPSVSADGRYVAFSSLATNLVVGDTNGVMDIFAHDMQLGTTTRVSVDSSGAQANAPSEGSAISTDGRYVAFSSLAANLVEGDTNGKRDAFLHDMQSGTTTRVSVSSSLAQANGDSYSPTISSDDGYIAFASLATNLVDGGTNGMEHIFVSRNILTSCLTPTPTVTPTETPSPTPPPSGPVTIDYVYDPLNRLKEANYSNGDYYHYTYDKVGNRLIEDKSINGQLTTDAYEYDTANRLIRKNGVDYTWDNNGNLLSDGVNTYTYDSANRLSSVNSLSYVVSYAYNGLGDRLQETLNGQTATFTIDLNSELAQTLSDGTHTYLYGLDHIAQVNGTDVEYFLGDELNSVRQLADASGAITLTKTYSPYGETLSSVGDATTPYGFAGEQEDANGLIYLRARYYQPQEGRFFQRDPWQGNPNSPATLNRYQYALNNPALYTDPSGQYCIAGFDIDWLGGDKCTEEEIENAAATLAHWTGFITSPNFALGIAYEIIDSLLIVGPETARIGLSLMINASPNLREGLEAITDLASALCGNDAPSQLLDTILHGIHGDYYFTRGRVVGRIIMLAWALSGITISTGGALVAAAAGPFTFGISWGGTAIAVSVDAYSVAILGNIAVKELSDGLIYKAISGKLGGSSDPTLHYGSNTGDTSKNADALRDNMGAQGKPGQAHHIVPSTHPYAQKARELLWKKFHIDINSATNGVLLPDAIHAGLANDHVYMDAVLQELQKANAGNINSVLQRIGQRLLNGTFPR